MPRNLGPTESARLAERIVEFAAEEIASAIDAGSERDAVTEDLLSFMRLYVDSWAYGNEDEAGAAGVLHVSWFTDSLISAANSYALKLYG